MIKAPISWLKDYVDIVWTPEQIAAGLTLRGLEVEAIIRTGAGWDKVVVGEVLSTDKHPNADRLGLVQITDGTRTYQVITGAMNLKAGDKCPLALPGARLIDGHKLHADGTLEGALERKRSELPYFTVKAGKMRGVESDAVACAELELGVSEEFDGIMVLDPSAPVGKPLEEVLGDVILDLDLSPNLGRALSIFGIAREIAAMTGQKVRFPKIEIVEDGDPVEGKISVRIDAPELCSRFSMMVIEEVKIGQSPAWMQYRLRATDQPVINNVVDVTNYVMLELGQPLHAYDYDDISSKQFIVRRAYPGEKMETIDHVERTFTPEVLLVTDAARSVGMAGVMGGADSEIKDTSVNIAMEGAHWDSFNVRATGRGYFAKVSEAAKRFERFVDPELTVLGVRRSIQLVQQLAGGRVAKGMIDEHPVKHSQRVVDLPLSEIPRVLGIEIPKETVTEMLEQLEFAIEDKGESLAVTVPTYRNDVTIKADLVEEVARMYGYDKIPEKRMSGELPVQTFNSVLAFEDKTRDVLTACGLSEIITYPLVNLADLEKLNAGGVSAENRWSDPAKLLKLANPLSSEHEYMRPTLLASTLTVLGENRRFVNRVAIFEIGRVYLVRENELQPEERRTLSIAMSGERNPLSRFTAVKDTEKLDYFDLKGVLEAALARLNLNGITFEPLGGIPVLHPGRAAAIYVTVKGEKKQIGILGELHPKVAMAFDLSEERVGVAELDIELMVELAQPVPYKTVTRMPMLSQDLAVIVEDDVPASRIEKLILETGGKLLTSATLFDLYRGKPIPEGKKSLAYRLVFQPEERNLTDEEGNKLREKIEKRLTREVGATFRG
jgi:phenylalanyl-tRNA synthetase beta chain